MTTIWRHYNHVCFPANFPLLANVFILSLLLYPGQQQQQKKKKFSLRLPYDILKTKICSKLALQSTDYCIAFTQSR